MPRKDALSHVLAQVKAAKRELDSYAPVGLGWYSRTLSSANTLIPWLVSEAPELQKSVEQILNSPKHLRAAWEALKLKIDASAEVAGIDELLNRQALLHDFIAGDKVSIAVSHHLVARFPKGELVENSKVDYPDLYLKTHDYSKLPTRTKKDQEFGAAVKGVERRPIRVPDGLEVKTSRGNAGIYCHFPHIGLHLMLSFFEKDRQAIVDDVLVAFLRTDDYYITKPRTGATTSKASFSRAPFISLLHSKSS